MGSSRPNHPTYDVFLSFRGEDTRHSFTSHLYEALVQAGVHTFRDDDEIPRGEDLKPEIEKAINKSKASVVILSENYANSRWCLDELVLILEQRRNFNHFVLPVFYHVNPSHVRNQRQSFAIETDEGVKGSKWTDVKVNQWKGALADVANLTGMVLSGSETDFIAKIVDTIVSKLDLKLVSTPAHLTGMETRSKSINSWLKTEQDVLAICGMGGSGKTTLARYIYNSNNQNFESCSFLEEIGKHCQQPNGLLGLQKQLLTEILGGRNKVIYSVSEGTRKIEAALQMKRVLIVLDDIDENDQLPALLGTKTFHTQSKIIITTRLLNIRGRCFSISQRCEVYELELMNDQESLELLSYHAFGTKIPMEGFKDQTVQLARYCEGNPLALKLLGSSLYVSTKDQHIIKTMKEIWESTLYSLNSLQIDVHSKIQGVLQRSFDSLPYNRDKELFLHIACFFVGEDKDYVVKILDHDWHAKSGIMTLINRSLLTVSPNNNLMMHQLLQDMGRKIVCEESKDPAKHSRVWCSDEAYRLLSKGGGSETIEGLALNMRKLKKRKKPFTLQTDSLVNMDKLKLLQLNYVELSGSYKNFPELRWLCWHGCLLKTIPAGLLMNSLVAIDMSYGDLRSFKLPAILDSLKILNLKGCDKLDDVSNLDRLPNLETLILSDCISLTHVCKTIRRLESLALLNLTGCIKLWKPDKVFVYELRRLKHLYFPEQPLFSLPRSLKFLLLDYCNLEHDYDFRVIFYGQPFFNMSLAGNNFDYLPKNIDLKMLRVLNVASCSNLKFLLCLPSTLEELYTHQCTSLEKITFQSGPFRLRKFGYERCLHLSDVQGLFKFVPIAKYDEAALGHMQWIKAYQDDIVQLVGDDIAYRK